MELGEIIVLLVIGALAGRAAASLMGERPNALLRNTLIGVAGAVVGGFLFQVFDISLPTELEATINLADILVAFLGAVLVIFILHRVE